MAATVRESEKNFWCEYDLDPIEVPPQILIVPVVAHLLAVAWLLPERRIDV